MSETAASTLLLTGATASGKSAVAMTLAARLGAEIISADSMQVYRGMDLGTAKPTPEDRVRIPHHLLDLAGPSEAFDAARWLALARTAHREIGERGRSSLLCGGTGLYFRLWLGGLDEASPPDPRMRVELEGTPLDALLTELQTRDPATFARIDRGNPRRVVRALERLRQTGRPLDPPQQTGTTLGTKRVIVLRREPSDLRQRIEHRVDRMFAAGLVAETRRLMEEGLTPQCTAGQAIGYRQVMEHFAGVRDFAATVTLVKTRTWQFARRQMTWFRHQLPVQWLDVTTDEPAAVTAQRILELRPAPG